MLDITKEEYPVWHPDNRTDFEKDPNYYQKILWFTYVLMLMAIIAQENLLGNLSSNTGQGSLNITLPQSESVYSLRNMAKW